MCFQSATLFPSSAFSTTTTKSFIVFGIVFRIVFGAIHSISALPSPASLHGHGNDIQQNKSIQMVKQQPCLLLLFATQLIVNLLRIVPSQETCHPLEAPT